MLGLGMGIGVWSLDELLNKEEEIGGWSPAQNTWSFLYYLLVIQIRADVGKLDGVWMIVSTSMISMEWRPWITVAA